MKTELEILSITSLWLSGFILGFIVARYFYKNK